MSAKILIVDSNEWLGDSLLESLSSYGFDVIKATNSYVAMDAIDDHHPDVLVMDLRLNGPSGLGLLHELQSYKDTAKIPIVVYDPRGTYNLDDLAAYGVARLLDSRTMTPESVAGAVRGALSEVV